MQSFIPSAIKTALLITLAISAFAANSILARAALKQALISAESFTVVRLVSGALFLSLLALFGSNSLKLTQLVGEKVNRTGVVTLIGYAAFFSFAYVALDAGIGAVILFASVQISMVAMHILTGNRLSGTEWMGLLLALGGFVALMLPGASAPDIASALMMTIAGVCWALYTVNGRKTQVPLYTTTYAFIGAAMLSLLLLPMSASSQLVTGQGVILAALSGAIASGAGYAIWYTVLPAISVLTASVVQLLVPVIAAFAGVVLLGEQMSLRMIASSVIILLGIMLVVSQSSSNGR